jgi:hypothetical protein
MLYCTYKDGLCFRLGAHLLGYTIAPVVVIRGHGPSLALEVTLPVWPDICERDVTKCPQCVKMCA